MNDRQPFLDAIAALPDAEFLHLAAVCVDAAQRLPAHAFGDVAAAARGVHDTEALQTIEYAPPAPVHPTLITLVGPDGQTYQVVAKPSPNDVTVGLSGVQGTGAIGKVGG